KGSYASSKIRRIKSLKSHHVIGLRLRIRATVKWKDERSCSSDESMDIHSLLVSHCQSDSRVRPFCTGSQPSRARAWQRVERGSGLPAPVSRCFTRAVFLSLDVERPRV